MNKRHKLHLVSSQASVQDSRLGQHPSRLPSTTAAKQLPITEKRFSNFNFPLTEDRRSYLDTGLMRTFQTEQIVITGVSGRIVSSVGDISLQTLSCEGVVGVEKFADDCIDHRRS
ncbi:hypothetical protein NPIL_165371 [Nephila pilipes]|uniref:Uncharacterized protein n=1 Tax=Nephila pilipes TaxID=299642 RepID=A0A8X6PUD3_NEPPI|nr:hypothetical protein NPIL_165371 [Nephila pilipes]